MKTHAAGHDAEVVVLDLERELRTAGPTHGHHGLRERLEELIAFVLNVRGDLVSGVTETPLSRKVETLFISQ
jgi:hypothetical protein